MFLLIFTPLLFIGGTLIFNAFWCGTAFPKFSTDLQEQRNYITVYISLLSFLSTVQGICLVIFGYGDWKYQHKQITISNSAKLCLDTLFDISSRIRNITVVQLGKMEITASLKDDLNIKINNLYSVLDKAVSDFIILAALSKNKDLRNNLTQLYADYMILVKGVEKIINEEVKAEDKQWYWDFEKECDELNHNMRNELMKIIDIK